MFLLVGAESPPYAPQQQIYSSNFTAVMISTIVKPQLPLRLQATTALL
jgi:hypothetical protein